MPMAEANGPTPIRRPCAADRIAPATPGHAYLKVPFARCTDGIARHVTAVAGQLLGPFVCLDCEERLTLRRPVNKRAHFAHRPDSLCAGETALHLYAKELLALRRTLTLPALILQDEGLSESVFESGIYEFKDVRSERNLGSFQPDAIVTYKGAELAIEFLVSHAVDPAKRAKVRQRDLSMVEIDLSAVRAGSLSAEELDRAILHTSPRHWIHHRRRAAATEKLAAQVAAKRAERGGRLKWHIEKKVQAAYPDGWADEATPSVKQAGLEHLLNIEVDCGHWFAVPRAIWQAHALDVHVIQPSRLYTPGGRSIAIRGEWPNEHNLASKLPDWMIRSDLSEYPPKRLAEAGYDRSTHGSPNHAVWNYLATLEQRGEAVCWSREDQQFIIEPALHGRLHRRVELCRRVTGLLAAVRDEDPDHRYRQWASSYLTGNGTPAELVEKGGGAYGELVRRIAAIEAMVPSYSRKVTDDLCGLPLEAICERNLAAIAADAAEEERKAKEAAVARRNAIQRQAGQMLESEADQWLNRIVEAEGISILDFAGGSDEALSKAERWLAATADKRRQAIAAAQHLAALKSELTRAARAAFPETVLADLFLNTGQPRLGGRRPIEHCDSTEALNYLKTLLPRRR